MCSAKYMRYKALRYSLPQICRSNETCLVNKSTFYWALFKKKTFRQKIRAA